MERGKRGISYLPSPHLNLSRRQCSRKGLSAGSGREQAKVSVLEDREKLNQFGYQAFCSDGPVRTELSANHL